MKTAEISGKKRGEGWAGGVGWEKTDNDVEVPATGRQNAAD